MLIYFLHIKAGEYSKSVCMSVYYVLACNRLRGRIGGSIAPDTGYV